MAHRDGRTDGWREGDEGENRRKREVGGGRRALEVDEGRPGGGAGDVGLTSPPVPLLLL